MRSGTYKCERCQHQWVGRLEHDPIVCPKCKSYLWSKPKSENGIATTPGSTAGDAI